MIYFDNAATTPLRPQVADYLQHAFEEFGNPSSLYDLGVRSHRLLEDSRAVLAKRLHCEARELIFCSCGSEASNLALRGIAETYGRRGRHLITTAIEHPSVALAMADLAARGFELTVLPVDAGGRVSPDALSAALRPDTLLVSVMLVNNELGTEQPVAELARRLREKAPQAFFHVDGVQAFGHLNVNVRKLDCDLFSLSGHKFGAPKGVGALYVREGLRLRPLIFGGGQERELRAGTENFYYAKAMALAAELACADRNSKNQKLAEIKGTLLAALDEAGVRYTQNGADAVPYITNLTFPGVRGETLLHYLEGRQIYVSQGSACHAKSQRPSETLSALGLSRDAQLSTIRLSFGDENTVAEAAAVARAIAEGVAYIGIQK